MIFMRRRGECRTHPVHALLLAFPIALFTAGLVTDIAYLRTEEIQWTNFSAWLIAGGLAAGALVLVWAVVDLVVARGRGRALVYVLLVAAMQMVGLFNAFQHSRDGWSSVGAAGLGMSIVTAVLALASGYIAHSRASDVREVPA